MFLGAIDRTAFGLAACFIENGYFLEDRKGSILAGTEAASACKCAILNRHENSLCAENCDPALTHWKEECGFAVRDGERSRIVDLLRPIRINCEGICAPIEDGLYRLTFRCR